MSNSYFIFSSSPVDTSEKKTFGEGSTCVIEQAWENDKRVFIKRLKPEYRGQELYENAFRKEYEIGSRLDSPYLPKYIRMDEDGSIYEEFVDGMPLDRFLNEEPDYFQEEHNLRRFLNELLQGISYLHARQILHLDLKPQNVMLTRLGRNVKIVDLGFAYTDSYITSTGTTKEFAAPELLDGSMLPDTSMDIYSIGCILRYIASTTNGKIPDSLLKIQNRCLQREPKNRYQLADDILKELDKTDTNNIRKPLFTRSRIAIAACAIVIVFVILGACFISKPPTSFPYKHHLSCNTISTDSMTVAITRDTTLTFDANSPQMDVTIPSTITHDGYTFSVIEIDSCTFMKCTPLIAIDLPNTLRSIGNSAFQDCDSLSHINIPDNVTYIGENAFRSCDILSSIKLPQELKVLEQGAFSLCNSLKEIEIPHKVKELRRDAFGLCISLESIKLPEGLEVIDRGVFWKCKSLKSITIPSTVTHFGDFVFWGCNSLTDVYMLNPEPPRITDIFEQHKLRLHVPAASVAKYRNSQYWKDLEIVEIKQE